MRLRLIRHRLDRMTGRGLAGGRCLSSQQKRGHDDRDQQKDVEGHADEQEITSLVLFLGVLERRGSTGSNFQKPVEQGDRADGDEECAPADRRP